MNWGWKIVLLYSAFVVMTLGMVFYFMGHDVELVADDYYKQEIEYQDQIDKLNNTRSLRKPIDISYSKALRSISITFPEEVVASGIKGSIQLYRPSSAAEDKQFEIRIDESGNQQISVGSLSAGLWKIKISFQSMGKDYYDEKVITL